MKLKHLEVRQQNKIRYLVSEGLRGIALIGANGTLMQAFLLSIGMSEDQVYLHASVWQAVNVLTILLGSRCADKGNILHRAAAIMIPQAILYLFYLPLCIVEAVSSWTYVAFLAVAVLHSITVGIGTVFEYKIPYYIFKPNEYGTVLAASGIMAHLLTLSIGILMTYLSAKYSYAALMVFGFVICAILMMSVFALRWYQKSLIETTEEISFQRDKKEKVPLKEVFTHPAFLQLLPAHVLRGFAYGTTTVLTVICASVGFDEAVITSTISAQSAAMLTGCVAVGLLLKYASPRIPIFAGSLLFFCFPMLLSQNKYVFLLGCFLIFFGRTLIDYSVSSVMLLAVPVKIAGPYNALRMAIHNGGILLATMSATVIPTSALIFLTLIFQVIAGCIYMWARILRKSAPLKRS